MAEKKQIGWVGRIIEQGRKNMFFPGISGHTTNNPEQANEFLNANITKEAKNLNKYRGPVQLVRIKVDTSYWRKAVAEAERPLASLPYRVMMQQIFIDTILNGHVQACVQKRKNMTLLKKFHICDENGETDEEATRLLETEWFQKIRNYIHDAQYYGYSLITFGNLIDGNFTDVQITRRADVSPDREVLSSFMYIPTGIQFNNPNAKDDQGIPYFDWSLWVTTPSENGVSKCGYGLLYKVALYEIVMRSIIGWNTDYVERFGQPTTVIKIQADNEDERGRAEEAATKLGSSGSLIIDKNDEFEMVADTGTGTSWKSYENLEGRCKKTVSAIILGHEDGISSTPGKLGGEQGGEQSPVMSALADCESTDARFEENVINNILIPKLIKLGLRIPTGKSYRIRNDQELAAQSKAESENAKGWAEIAVSMNTAGMKMSAEEFSERTGIKATDKIEEPVEDAAPAFGFNRATRAKLNDTYRNTHPHRH